MNYTHKENKVSRFIGIFIMGLFSVTLLLQYESLPMKLIVAIILIVSAFFLDRRKLKSLMIFVLFAGAFSMLCYSVKNIPTWPARTSYIGTDTVWGRNTGYTDSLIFTIIHEKKCVIEDGCWYSRYIERIAKKTVYYEGRSEEPKEPDKAIADGFVEVGWMHIDANFLLLSNEANSRYLEIKENETGETLNLFVKPDGLYESDTVLVYNDDEGNIYIEEYVQN